MASAVTVTVSFRLPTSRATSTSAVPAARSSTPVFSNFLKFVRDDLDPVGPWSEVGRLVATLRVGLDRPRYAGRFVGDEHRRARNDLALGIDTVPRIVPRNDCANAGVLRATAVRSRHRVM